MKKSNIKNKSSLVKPTIHRSVIDRLDILREKYDRSYTEVIKQLLLDTGNWKLKKHTKET